MPPLHFAAATAPVHFAAATAPVVVLCGASLVGEGATLAIDLDLITCERCRAAIMKVGALYTKARRSKRVSWLRAPREGPPPEPLYVLEEFDETGEWRRFDLHRFLTNQPGEYSVTLRIREGKRQ